ncbi:MAG: helix-turn-helix transcriptional regulator [Mucilaginibacter sp.]
MKTVFEPFCTALNFRKGTASLFYSSHVTPLHAHNTLQLVFDLKSKFLFRTAQTRWKEYNGILIRENVIHQLDTNDSLQLIIYLDPSATTAQQLKDKYLQDADCCELNIVFSPLEESLIHQNLMEPGARSLGLLIDLIFNRINDESNLVLNNKRISDILKLIKQTDPAELSIGQLASKVFISPSRLRMQFKQLLGVSLHQYIIRHKIISAVNAIVNGFSIQDAAYRSGFNDSSHLSKLMFKTFDINPSTFLRANRHFLVVRDDNTFGLETVLANEV